MTAKKLVLLSAFAAIAFAASHACLAQQNDLGAEISKYEKALEQKPDSTEILFKLEKLYIQSGRFIDAEKAIGRITDLQPENPAAYSEYGYLFDIQGKHEDALMQHNKSVNIDPNYPLGYLNLGLSLYYLNMPEKSREAFDKALATNLKLLDAARNWPAYTPEEILTSVSEQVFLITNVALCYLFTDRPYKALEYLELAQGFAPDDQNITALINKARESIEKTMNSGSITSEHFEKLKAARQCIADNSPAEAISIYNELLALGIDSHEVRINLGKAYDMTGDTDNSIANYLAATGINPENPIGFYNLGLAYIKKGKINDAFKAMQRSVELNPSFTFALVVLGKLELERGLNENAELHLSRAAALSPSMQEPRDLLCILFMHTASYERALAVGRDWLNSFPDSSDAAACLASVLHLSGNDDEARDVITAAIEKDKNNMKLAAVLSMLPSPSVLVASVGPAEKQAPTLPPQSKSKSASNNEPKTRASASKAPPSKPKAAQKKTVTVVADFPAATATVGFKKTPPATKIAKAASPKPSAVSTPKTAVKKTSVTVVADFPIATAQVGFKRTTVAKTLVSPAAKTPLKAQQKPAAPAGKPKEPAKKTVTVVAEFPSATATVGFRKTPPATKIAKAASPKPSAVSNTTPAEKKSTVTVVADFPVATAQVGFDKQAAKSPSKTTVSKPAVSPKRKTAPAKSKPPTLAAAKKDSVNIASRNTDIGIEAGDPIPIPPAMTKSVEKQIKSFGEDFYISPPSELAGFDDKTIARLRAGIKGRWLFQDNNNLIWLRPASGGNSVKIASGMQPSASADGKSVVYIAREGSERTVRLFSLSSWKEQIVFSSMKFAKSSGKAFFSQPKLSPNGKYVSALVNNGNGIYTLILKKFESSSHMMPIPGFDIRSYSWSSDGNKVYFTSTPCGRDSKGEDSCVGELSISTGKVKWLDAFIKSNDGGQDIGIGILSDPVVALSNSGRYLLMYDSGMGSSGNIIITDLAAGTAISRKPSDLSGNNVKYYGLSWAFDDTHLVFSDPDETVWCMRPDGSEAFPAARFIHGAVSPVLLMK